MTKITRDDIGPEAAAPFAKKAWTAPKLESIRGSDASASFQGSGGIDYGIYS